LSSSFHPSSFIVHNHHHHHHAIAFAREQSNPHRCFRRKNLGVFGKSSPLGRDFSDFTVLIACSMCVIDSDRRIVARCVPPSTTTTKRTRRNARAEFSHARDDDD